MPGAEILFTLNDRAFEAARRRLVEALDDLSPAMDEIGNSLATSARHRFETQRSPDGEPWEPSAAAWGKTSATETGKTLVARGHLRDSITHEADGETVRVGTNVVYAAIHQFGGEITPKRGSHLVFKVGDGFVRVSRVEIPARPYLGIDDDDRAEIDHILEDHFLGGLGGDA